MLKTNLSSRICCFLSLLLLPSRFLLSINISIPFLFLNFQAICSSQISFPNHLAVSTNGSSCEFFRLSMSTWHLCWGFSYIWWKYTRAIHFKPFCLISHFTGNENKHNLDICSDGVFDNDTFKCKRCSGNNCEILEICVIWQY